MNDSRSDPDILKEIGFTLLSEGKTLKIRAEGYSMFPSIRPGSVIHIGPYPQGALPVHGEIIAWKRESGLVVHRLVRMVSDENGTLFITRGDSTLHEDPPVTAGQIAGRVHKVEYRGMIMVLQPHETKKKPFYIINRSWVVVLMRLKKFKRILTSA